MMMDSRDDEDREYDELDDDSFDNPVLESEIEADLIEEWCPVCREIKPHAVIGTRLRVQHAITSIVARWMRPHRLRLAVC